MIEKSARSAAARRAGGMIAAGLASVAVLLAVACGGGPGGSDANAAPQSSGTDSEVFFPERLPGGEDMLAQTRGKLVLDGRGCLRVRRDGASPTIVWPTSFEARRASGEVKVVNGKGKTVAQVGREVLMGGGEGALKGTKIVDKPTRRELQERCPGSYWAAAPPVRMPRP